MTPDRRNLGLGRSGEGRAHTFGEEQHQCFAHVQNHGNRPSTVSISTRKQNTCQMHEACLLIDSVWCCTFDLVTNKTTAVSRDNYVEAPAHWRKTEPTDHFNVKH